MTVDTILLLILLLLVGLLLVVTSLGTLQLAQLLALVRRAVAGPVAFDPPLPLDEARPPKVKTYDGDPDGLRCDCHGELIRPGSEVMLWPIPGSEKTHVFCELKIPGGY